MSRFLPSSLLQSRVFFATIAFGFLSFNAQALELKTKDIVLKKDVFSIYKLSSLEEPFAKKLKSCFDQPEASCLKYYRENYSKKFFKVYRGLLNYMSLDYLIKKRRNNLSLIDFVEKDQLHSSFMSRLVRNFSGDEILSFYGEKFELSLEAFLIKNPQFLCKFSKRQKRIDQILKKLPQQKNFYDMNLSSFPCGLNLGEGFQGFKKELKTLGLKSGFKKVYKFKSLQKKSSLKIYRSMYANRKNYKKNPKAFWKKLLLYPKEKQTRVLKNFFYRGQYKILAEASKVRKKIENLSFESLMYVLKSMVVLDKQDEILSLSENIDLKKSKFVEEILMMRLFVFANKKDYSKALEVAELALQKSVVNLKLSFLYWGWFFAKQTQEKKQEEDFKKRILRLYPFSYYGIQVASFYDGPGFFDKYLKRRHHSSRLSQLSQVEQQKLKFYYASGVKELFKKYYRSIEHKLKTRQKALFALVFSNLGYAIESIRILNLAWDEDQSLRAEPYISSSFLRDYEEMSKKYAKKRKWVNANTIQAVIRQESAFNVYAESPSRARGLMQIIPSTAKEVARGLRLKSYKNSKDLFKPEMNLSIGSKYMDRLIAAGKGYLPYAFASYNAGPGKMYKWTRGRSAITDLRQGLNESQNSPIKELWVELLPWTETRFYVKALMRNYAIYEVMGGERKAFHCQVFWRCK